MDKNKIDRFINKYHLAGKVNSVKWKSGEDKLTATFVTEDKSLLGQVSADNFSFEECELGIYDTDQLQKLLGVLSDNIKMSLVKFGKKPLSLKVENENASVDYVLSDLSVIPEPPTIKKIPKCTNAFLEVSSEGLARINFKVDDFDAVYYMVANNEVD